MSMSNSIDFVEKKCQIKIGVWKDIIGIMIIPRKLPNTSECSQESYLIWIILNYRLEGEGLILLNMKA